MTEDKMEYNTLEKCLYKKWLEEPETKENFPHKKFIEVIAKEWECLDCKGYGIRNNKKECNKYLK